MHERRKKPATPHAVARHVMDPPGRSNRSGGRCMIGMMHNLRGSCTMHLRRLVGLSGTLG